MQDIWLDYQIGDRTLLSEIRQLRSGETIDARTGCSRTSASAAHPEMAPDALSAASTFGDIPSLDTAILELSGGVDSRLALALLLEAGLKPRRAFTLGSSDESDVAIAHLICRRFGIEHIAIDPATLPAPTFDQIATFVSASLFRANAASLGWFPCLFEHLADMRDAQITGTGGECAEGFYFTPIDWLIRTKQLRRLWIQLRLFDGSPTSLATPFEPSITAQAYAMTVAEVEQSLSGRGPWRNHLWWLYRENRMRTWALPVLLASSRWYTVIAPFLSPVYLNSAEALTDRDRTARRWQIHCIAKAFPQLLDIPFAADPRGVFRPTRLASRLLERVGCRAGPASMRAPDTVRAILAAERFRALLKKYGDELGLQSGCQTPQALSASGSRLIGAVTTALLACEARDSCRYTSG